MTGSIGTTVTAQVLQRIKGPSGANANLAALTGTMAGGLIGMFDAAQIRTQNAAAELSDRSTTVQYPAMQVYCEKIVNDLRTKFQSFSGGVQMAIEVRHSQDGIDGLQDALGVYAGAVMQMLDGCRGDWGEGIYYAGGYQVAFGAVKHGGRNFLQSAKVTFEIGVNSN
jgi:hypothetical protein